MNLPQPLRRRGVVWLVACLACLALLAVYDRFAWTREISITIPPRETPPPVLVATSQEPREELLNDIVELREFNVEDNPAYRPETELSPTAGDTAGSAIRSKVTELLSKGASHIISHVLSGRRNTGDASPPSQTGQGEQQQVPQQVQQQQQQQPPQTQFQPQPLQQAQKPAQEQVVVHFNPPQQQQQVQPQQLLQFDQQQQHQLQLQQQQFQQQQAQQAAKQEPKRFTPPHQVLVHLDLKGAPPSVPFLRDVIALSAGLGATGLLIEWEDKFPYWGELAPVAAGNAYTREQAQEILDTARKYNMTVMPLVQTFGHLEYVLKLPQFASIREDPASPQALCPSRNESDRLVETLLDQVMSLHMGAERVHIGSDEVFVLGKCDLCRRRRRDDLLLGHIALTANYVRRKYNATAVLWEDMLRNAASSKLREYGLDSGLVEPMLWWYTPDVRRYVSPMVWRHAERMYPHVWGAGAYKGAFGSALFSPIIDKQVQNNLDWTELLAEEDSRLTGGVRGLVLTGWSRYDHFATPAELMAAAVPSLAFSIASVCRGALDDVASEAAQRALGCPRPTPLRQLSWPYLYAEMSQCRFPGHRVYMMMDRYNRTFTAVREYLTKFESGHESSWLGRYNERHNFTSVLKVREELPKLMSLRHNTARMLKPLYQELIAIYDRDLVLEWLEYRMLPLLEDLDALRDRMEALKKRTNFPARPLKDYSKRLISYMDEFVSGWRGRPSR